MKKIMLALAMSVLLFACSSGGPEAAVKNFSENVAKGKIDEAKKYATESTGAFLDLAKGFGSLPVDPNYKFEMLKDSIVDNKAWVTFVNQKGETETIELVKIDGNWLVHMDAKK